MENKYYTPEISEFYIGFEYQYVSNMGVPTDDTSKWDSFLFGNQYKFKSWDWKPLLKDCLKRKLIRVKYLNQEDIERLGFTDKKTTVLDWYTSEKRSEDNWASYGYWNNFRLLHDRDKNKVQIIAYKYGWDEGNILFQGDCKNKSELIRILNQVGYGK